MRQLTIILAEKISLMLAGIGLYYLAVSLGFINPLVSAIYQP